MAALAGATLALLSGYNLLRAQQLQNSLDQAQALGQARAQIMPLLQHPALPSPAASIHRAVDALVHESGLGFLFLAVRDAEGSVLASAGRYENLGLWATLREPLYLWRSRKSGQTSLTVGAQRLGALEYALADPEQRLAHEQAVDQLRWSGWAGVLLSLPLLGLGLRRSLRLLRDEPRARVALRLAPPPPRHLPERGADSIAPPGASASHWLDPLGFGVVLMQRDGRVRETTFPSRVRISSTRCGRIRTPPFLASVRHLAASTMFFSTPVPSFSK